MRAAIQELLEAIGDQQAIQEETPLRVAEGIAELLDGYEVDIDSLFVTEDDEGKDQVVIVRNIDFTSLCSHHLLPFSGHAHVGYLPKERVLGVSKIARLVLAYAHRLQLQERLTKQVAHTLMERLRPEGVAVVIVGEHTCMRCRGVRSTNSQVVTSEVLGAFRKEAALRSEFLSLLLVNK